MRGDSYFDGCYSWFLSKLYRTIHQDGLTKHLPISLQQDYVLWSIMLEHLELKDLEPQGICMRLESNVFES